MKALLSYLILIMYTLSYIETFKFKDSLYDILPFKYECGQQEADNYDHPNTGTQADEFPWLVYIPLESRVYNPLANLRCAGTLISKRYVLISKSCLQFVLTKLHLGQHDISKNVTCDDCEDVIKIDVEERIIDDDKDVALLRLKQDVNFSDYIKPICLPFDDFIRAEVGTTVYTSGWGLENVQGNATKIKKKVKHAIMEENSECQKSNKYQGIPSKDLICIKVEHDSLNVPCYGDEGSPIMFSSDGHWILEGILSGVFSPGDGPCAINAPAVGTKITDEILEWIVNNVRE